MAELLRQIHISGTTIERLAETAAGMDYLTMLDADWWHLRETGVEEIHRIQPMGHLVVMHHYKKMPWMFKSISDPPPLPEVHPAVRRYVQGRGG